MITLSAETTAAPHTETALRPPDRSRMSPLGERLIHSGLLSADELESALGAQAAKNVRLGEVLVEMGLVSEDDLLPIIAQQLNVSYVRLREGIIDPKSLQLLSRQTAADLQALALFSVRGVLTVAMSEPQDLHSIDEIERLTGLRVRPVFALQSAIERMMRRCYEDDFAVDAVTADLAGDAVEVQSEAIDLDVQNLQQMADGSPVVNLVSYIIIHAVRQGASDIHIEPGQKNSTVRYRVDGQLREVLTPRRDFHPAIVSRIKVMGRLDIAEHRAPQDGRIRVVVESREIDLRVSTLPTVLGEKVVMRVLDKRNVTFNLDQLGLPPAQLERTKSILARPYGLALVTGPTGSGKTTTLYSAIELIKSITRNIVTVEDPVEYQLELINQVQTSAGRTMTFASALRAILRQDPDVIMVGEIRDAETAEVAIQAALTGHLVLSTLHTNDSAGAVTRLQDMGIAPYKIAAAIVGVIAQRLVRTLCPHCRSQYYPPAPLLEMIRYTGDARRQFARGEGCPKCFDTGFQGRRGIYEVLIATRELRELISRNETIDRIRECHLQQGGTLLLEEGIRFAEQGRTSLDEVIRVAFFD